MVAIEKAKIRCPSLNFYFKDLNEKDALKDFDADTFIILEVLEHIEMDIDLLSKIPSREKVIFSVPNFDSFNHVRFFKDSASVNERYAPYFKSLSINEVKLSGNSIIYCVTVP